MIIGITGTLGSGKGTVTEYLISKGYKHAGVTAFMRSVAESRGISPIVRMTYHDIANEYRAMGPTKLMEATLEKARAEGGDNFVLEALHTIPEVQYVQSQGGKVIAVDADLRIRYERILGRGGDKDNTTFEDFAKHEELEKNPNDKSSNDLAGAAGAADFLIQNNGTLEELHAQIDDVLKKISA